VETGRTFIAIQLQSIFAKGDSVPRTFRGTLSTADTFNAKTHQLVFTSNQFRIMAPTAPQRATFEKYRCPYAGSVCGTELLDAADQR
jgi:hypothetical protein